MDVAITTEDLNAGDVCATFRIYRGGTRPESQLFVASDNWLEVWWRKTERGDGRNYYMLRAETYDAAFGPSPTGCDGGDDWTDAEVTSYRAGDVLPWGQPAPCACLVLVEGDDQ